MNITPTLPAKEINIHDPIRQPNESQQAYKKRRALSKRIADAVTLKGIAPRKSK